VKLWLLVLMGRLIAMRLIVMLRFHPVMETPSQLHDGRPGDNTSPVSFNDRILFIDA
jgi:hypothetical protein